MSTERAGRRATYALRARPPALARPAEAAVRWGCHRRVIAAPSVAPLGPGAAGCAAALAGFVARGVLEPVSQKGGDG
ncbi:MAG: hypothetical protein ACRDQW_13890 [Haloechinothrix sp.]